MHVSVHSLFIRRVRGIVVVEIVKKISAFIAMPSDVMQHCCCYNDHQRIIELCAKTIMYTRESSFPQTEAKLD